MREQFVSVLLATLAAGALLGVLLQGANRPGPLAPAGPVPGAAVLPDTRDTGVGSPDAAPPLSTGVPAARLLAIRPPPTNGRVLVLDVADPIQPRPVGESGPLSDLATRPTVHEQQVYVPELPNGLRILDTTDPADDRRVGPSHAALQVRAATGSGRHVYVTENSVPDHSTTTDYLPGATNRLRLLDVADPFRPREIGLWPLPFQSAALAVADGYLYVAAYERGLRVLDVDDSAGPNEVATHEQISFALDVAVEGSRAYVSDLYRGLRILDVHDPRQPVELGVYETGGVMLRFVVSGSYAYIVSQQTGLHIVDVSEPTRPTRVGVSEAPRYANDVAVAGSTVFVADGSCGLRILDARDPTRPAQIGAYATPALATGVAVAAEQVYVTTSRTDLIHACPAD